MNKLQPANPVFVVGLFRSGTSLLYALLNQNPRIALMFECNVWDFPDSLSPLRFRQNWLERQEFFNRVLSRHRLILGGRMKGLESVNAPEDLYRTYAEGRGAACWGEKSPYYASRLRTLGRRYPGCSIILLWRDPLEVHRSVTRAGLKDRYFRRRGMLNRVIHYQEAMIQQGAELVRAGIRVHHVTYSDLISNPGGVCQEICDFLRVEYDPAMSDLKAADFSAIDRSTHHDHLRRGIIERQDGAGSALDKATVQKLERFKVRWNRLRSARFGHARVNETCTEPGLIERGYHHLAGSLVCAHDSVKRALFEFLPLTWLQTYRQCKDWLGSRQPERSGDGLTFWQRLWTHKVTILASYGVLAGVVVVDEMTGPAMTFAAFYSIPCAALTLIVNRHWGTVAAGVSSVFWSYLQLDHLQAISPSVLAWNSIMRFIVLQILVVLLDRIRAEAASSSGDPA